VSRLGRFLHIERSRATRPGDAPDPSAATAERIEGVEGPGRDPGQPATSGAELERFEPAPPPSIELATAGAGERPFTRCMRCGMDHSVFVTECSHCGASLDTEPQREFNERLWAQRQEETAREEAAEVKRRARQALADDGAEGASGTRALGEAIAREVGAAERARLDAELATGAGGAVRRLLGWLVTRIDP
jgi:hypothetical protein